MNTLPESRRAVYGRTYSRQYRHSDFDPIERPKRPFLTFQDALAAVLVGVLLTALLLHALDALVV